MTLSLPPFTRAVTWLVGINTGVFLLMELMGLMGLSSLYVGIRHALWLLPNDVVSHGKLWQIVTYSFLHDGFWHLFGNMLGLWMFGASIEGAWGTRRFVELYIVGVIGAAVTTVVLSYAHILGKPNVPTVGASGGVFAILIAFGVMFAESEIMMIPFPFLIKAKYLIGILIVITLALAMSGGDNVAYVAHLGGLLFGYLYVRRGPKPAMVNLGLSERYYALRNSYYRWKRRRAARKFEVYMQKHDRQVHFDEHGNYVPPDEDPRKGNGDGKSGWVN
ncbi:MAG TPA: rhomboid family intramembrane serine protease [Candidatus Sulfotelmatobacter sp.]|nr:rhomboid family intramembrane serine protease [Candidatus Sulfotelmatobacter sp.]